MWVRTFGQQDGARFSVAVLVHYQCARVISIRPNGFFVVLLVVQQQLVVDVVLILIVQQQLVIHFVIVVIVIQQQLIIIECGRGCDYDASPDHHPSPCSALFHRGLELGVSDDLFDYHHFDSVVQFGAI